MVARIVVIVVVGCSGLWWGSFFGGLALSVRPPLGTSKSDGGGV